MKKTKLLLARTAMLLLALFTTHFAFADNVMKTVYFTNPGSEDLIEIDVDGQTEVIAENAVYEFTGQEIKPFDHLLDVQGSHHRIADENSGVTVVYSENTTYVSLYEQNGEITEDSYSWVEVTFNNGSQTHTCKIYYIIAPIEVKAEITLDNAEATYDGTWHDASYTYRVLRADDNSDITDFFNQFASKDGHEDDLMGLHHDYDEIDNETGEIVRCYVSRRDNGTSELDLSEGFFSIESRNFREYNDGEDRFFTVLNPEEGGVTIYPLPVTIIAKSYEFTYDGEDHVYHEWEIAEGSFVEDEVFVPTFDEASVITYPENSPVANIITSWVVKRPAMLFTEGNNNPRRAGAEGKEIVMELSENEEGVSNYEITLEDGELTMSYDPTMITGLVFLDADDNQVVVSVDEIYNADGAYVFGENMVYPFTGYEIEPEFYGFEYGYGDGVIALNEDPNVDPNAIMVDYGNNVNAWMEDIYEDKAPCVTITELVSDGQGGYLDDLAGGVWTVNFRISPMPVSFTVYGVNVESPYDGTLQNIPGSYTVTVTDAADNDVSDFFYSNLLPDEFGFDYIGDGVYAERRDVGTAEFELYPEAFMFQARNFEMDGIGTNNGSLTITPLPLTITTGTHEWTYDGNQHSHLDFAPEYAVEGTLAEGEELRITFSEYAVVKDVTDGEVDNQPSVVTVERYNNETGEWEPSGYFTEDGDDDDEEPDFVNNYDITVNVGTLKVNPVTDEIIITVTGVQVTASFDQDEHVAEGFYYDCDDEFFNTYGNFTFTPSEGMDTYEDVDGVVWPRVARTKAGKTPMGLTEANFSWKSETFPNVQFVLEDGYVDIESLSYDILIVGNHLDNMPYTNFDYCVTGYKWFAKVPVSQLVRRGAGAEEEGQDDTEEEIEEEVEYELVPAEDFFVYGVDFTGPTQTQAIIQAKVEGKSYMRLKPEMFKSLNESVEVNFEVIDGYIHIVYPATALVNETKEGNENIETINSAVMNINGMAEAVLEGRTLYKDGSWNTICLPFDVNIESSPLAGGDARELNDAAFADGTLTLNFTEEGEVKTLKAGVPYIIKWAEGENLTEEDLHFYGVKLTAELQDKTIDLGDGKSVTFKGTYSTVKFEEDNTNALLVGAENNLYYPQAGAYLNAQRAYFQLEGIYAGEKSAEAAPAFVLTFGDATVINGISVENASNEYFDLSGRRVAEPTTGIYIVNGKKIIVK